MEDEDEARSAVAELHGYEIDGMYLRVEVRIEEQLCFTLATEVSLVFVNL